jgi:hypothetical protein
MAGLLLVAKVQAELLALPVQSLFKKYCLDCHDPDTASGGLVLSEDDWNLADVAATTRLVRVHDKLSAGEMPPPEETQPSTAERQAGIDSLAKQLHDASRTRQRREGRVLLRRLNRIEYENTLHDLLGISIELRDMLPEDATVAGFDKVSVGLETSGVHLVLYQQAAERAIEAAMPQRPVRQQVQRTTGRELWESFYPPGNESQRRSSDLHLHYSARLEGDAIVFYEQTESNRFLDFPYGNIPAAGRYRIRASGTSR